MRPPAPATASFTRRCSLRGAGGDHVAVEAVQLAVLEVDRELALLALLARTLAPVHVVPAIGVENVGEQRRAERLLDLVLAHARLEQLHHVLRDEVALL